MPAENDHSSAWEYTIVHTNRLPMQGVPQVSGLWKNKYSDGTTDWDQIMRLGEEGWEMVSSFPIDWTGTTQYLTFIFKRPKPAARPSALPPPAETAADPPPGLSRAADDQNATPST